MEKMNNVQVAHVEFFLYLLFNCVRCDGLIVLLCLLERDCTLLLPRSYIVYALFETWLRKCEKLQHVLNNLHRR